jgi:uncharacterized protein (TIGR02001 family)
MVILPLLAVSAAFAQIQYNTSVSTDYIARGTSQTLGKPALSIGADYSYQNLYIGTWTSNVDFDDGTKRELDLYTGYYKTIKNTSLDFGFLFYGYFNAPINYNMIEYKLAVKQQFKKLLVTVQALYSPDYFNVSGKSLWLETILSYAIDDKLTISGAYGKQYIYSGGTYGTYNIGATYILYKNLSIDCRYSNTDHHDYGDIYQNTVTTTLKLTF